MRRNASPEERKAYYAARYQRLKQKIYARRQERLAADPDFREHERLRSNAASRRQWANMPQETRDRRNALARRRRNLATYGVENPVKGTPSLDGTRFFGVRKDSQWPPRTRSSSRSKTKRTPATRRAASPRSGKATTAPRSQPSSPKPSRSSPATRTSTRRSQNSKAASATTARTTSSPWIPSPTSQWEPGLAQQAYREFHV